MSFVLRDYQAEAIKIGVEFLKSPTDGKYRNGLMSEPTGSGKSLIIGGIVSQLNEPTIVFQPTKEILEQNFAKLVAFGYNPAVYSASVGQKKVRGITLATIGSVVRKTHLFNQFKYIIIDEAHAAVNPKNEDGMFMKFLDALPEARVLGLTATPYRLCTDGFGGSILKFLTRTRPRVFHKLIHVTQNGDLFAKGYLAKLEYKQVKTGFREDRLRLNTTGADYTDESVRQHFLELNFSDQIVRCVNRVGELKRGPVLVFTRFVEEAEYVASKVPGAKVVSAKTKPCDRDSVIRAFRNGAVPCVCNVGVLTVGFDYPELANVILARPTRSLALYYQMSGRVVRPHPSKQTAFIIDMVGLVEQFGRLEDLYLDRGPHDTWFVRGTKGQLTNVYFGQPRDSAVGSVQPPPVKTWL